MAYSSITQLRYNLAQVTIDRMADAEVTYWIAHADDDLAMDIGKYVNLSKLPTAGYSDANFPAWMNHLSQYKTCEHVLVKLFGAKRTVDDITDIQYWTKQYDELLQSIKTNRIEAILVDGTDISKGQFETSIGRTAISPVLGSGKYGKFEEQNDLANDRPRGASAGGADELDDVR